MNKKVLGVFLALCMLVAALPTAVFAKKTASDEIDEAIKAIKTNKNDVVVFNDMTMDEFLRKGAFAPPPTATVYRTMREDAGWICPVCGYHYSGETIPEGYLCPLCRCPGGKFEKKTG